MTRTTLALLAGLALLFGLATPSRAETGSGRDVFIASECNECHSVRAEGIEKLPPKEGEEDAEEEEEDLFAFEGDELGADEEESEPPDLSGVGRDLDPEWTKKFLRKKAENEDGKRHRKLFKGTDAELDALVAFLVTLKTPAPEADE